MSTLVKNTPLFLLLILEVFTPILSHAYPISITRFENEGSLYVESTSILRNGRFTKLTYVEDFGQPRSYGEISYISKATDIRIDCPARRIYALTEYYYSQPSASGRLLGKFSMDDQFGSNAERGRWVSEIVHIGCDPR